MSKLDDIFHTLFNEVEGEIWEAYYDTSEGEPYRKAKDHIKDLFMDMIDDIQDDMKLPETRIERLYDKVNEL